VAGVEAAHKVASHTTIIITTITTARALEGIDLSDLKRSHASEPRTPTRKSPRSGRDVWPTVTDRRHDLTTDKRLECGRRKYIKNESPTVFEFIARRSGVDSPASMMNPS